jgi:hypothetical protein
MRELDRLQDEADKRDAAWKKGFIGMERTTRRWGQATKHLTWLSGVLLVAGLLGLVGFAFVNARFEETTETTMSETKAETEIQKRGQEDHQPLRPTTTTATTTTTTTGNTGGGSSTKK